MRGEGEDSGHDSEPRVPLALHPGLQIFRPYRGWDQTLCYSEFWLLDLSQPATSNLRSTEDIIMAPPSWKRRLPALPVSLPCETGR